LGLSLDVAGRIFMRPLGRGLKLQPDDAGND